MPKALLLLSLAALSLAACGGGPCADDSNGTWTDAAGVKLELDASCAYRFIASNCLSSGTYAAPLSNQGTVQVEITSTSGGPCYPIGTYFCSYVLTGNSLIFNCGAGTDVFSR